MRTVEIGGKKIGLKATPLGFLYYQREFGSDLTADAVKLAAAEKDLSKLNTVILLQMIWVMNKLYVGMGKPFPGFEEWLAQFEYMNLGDENMILAVMEEIENGFFRQGQTGGPKPPAKSK